MPTDLNLGPSANFVKQTWWDTLLSYYWPNRRVSYVWGCAFGWMLIQCSLTYRHLALIKYLPNLYQSSQPHILGYYS